MAIRLRGGAEFLHIPKTGGSWVTEVLQSQGLVDRQISHIHAEMIRVRFYEGSARAVIRSAYELAKGYVPRPIKQLRGAQDIVRGRESSSVEREPFRFCFVRHPLRWYESFWRYLHAMYQDDWTQARDLGPRHPCAVLRDLGASTCMGFVENVNRVRPGFVTELYGRYTQLGISFVGKQEQLADDLVVALTEAGVSFDEATLRDAAPVNVSDRGARALEWDEGIRRETLRLEYAGLVRYGYVAAGADPV